MEKTGFLERTVHGTPAFPAAIYHAYYDESCKILFALHYHRDFEFLLVTEGKVRVQYHGEAASLGPGEGIFINSGMLHTAVSMQATACRFTAVVFSPDFIAREPEAICGKYISPLIDGQLSFSPVLSQEAVNLLLETSQLWEEQSFGYELLVRSNLTRMMALLLARAEYEPCGRPDHKMALTKGILNFIHENYRSRITLDDMADHMHISGAHICRIFKEVSGMSPFVYLNRYRIMQSTDMLLNTDSSISEIALSCGFHNSSYFNKMFLRFMNCTPTQYRHKNSQASET